MKHGYLIGHVVTPRGVCRLGTIQKVTQWAHMMQNEPQGSKFPRDASFKMKDEFPKDIKLADALSNNNSFLVVSEKLRDFLIEEDLLAHNEVHSVAIVNHKGRKEKAPYFIIHQIDDPKCLDEKKTQGVKSTIIRDQYEGMEKMVLDEKKIPADRMIFRAAEYRDCVLVRGDAAAKIEEAGFSGVEFCDPEEFDDFV